MKNRKLSEIKEILLENGVFLGPGPRSCQDVGKNDVINCRDDVINDVINFSKSEQVAIRAILRDPRLSAARLADILGVKQRQAQRIVASLKLLLHSKRKPISLVAAPERMANGISKSELILEG